jgi:hypothetical protein
MCVGCAIKRAAMADEHSEYIFLMVFWNRELKTGVYVPSEDELWSSTCPAPSSTTAPTVLPQLLLHNPVEKPLKQACFLSCLLFVEQFVRSVIPEGGACTALKVGTSGCSKYT